MNILDQFELMQALPAAYGRYRGRRVRITNPMGETDDLWLLGQEYDYLVLGREPYPTPTTKRDMSVRHLSDIVGFEVLEDTIDPSMPAFEHGVGVDPDQMPAPSFVQGRVAVVATNPSGSRFGVDVCGLEKQLGGYFESAPHLLGFSLMHLHGDLVNWDLAPRADLPFTRNWFTKPGAYSRKPATKEASAFVDIRIFEMPNGQLGGHTTPHFFEPMRPALAGRERLVAWAYEKLWAEAQRIGVIDSRARPIIKRSNLPEPQEPNLPE